MDRSKVLKVKKANNTWLTLPYCLYTISPVPEYDEFIMQSGKKRKQFVGVRLVLKGTIDYIKQQDLTDYNTIAYTGLYTDVQYINEFGNTVTGKFSITPFKPTVLIYKNNVPVWHEVAIEMEAQEVV